MADQLDEIRRQIERGTRVISLSGLISPAAKASVLARLRSVTDRTFVVVTGSNSEMESWIGDLSYYAGGGDGIIALPSFEIDPYSGASPHAETQERRALALWQMRRQDAGFIVMPARSLIQRTVSPAAISAMRNSEKQSSVIFSMRIVARMIWRDSPASSPTQTSMSPTTC